MLTVAIREHLGRSFDKDGPDGEGHRQPLGHQRVRHARIDAGARKAAGGLEFVGRGNGFSDTDPTGTDPRGSQIRRAVRRAGFLVDRAEEQVKK
jgi:hypothetical protein